MKIVKVDAQGRISLKKVVSDIDQYEYFKVITKNGVIMVLPIENEERAVELGMKEAELEMEGLEIELIANGEL